MKPRSEFTADFLKDWDTNKIVQALVHAGPKGLTAFEIEQLFRLHTVSVMHVLLQICSGPGYRMERRGRDNVHIIQYPDEPNTPKVQDLKHT